MSRIFISYKRVDKDKVFKIKDQIESALGEKCWIDLDGIESDAQFKNVIIKAINQAEIVLFMYSKAHSKIVDFENDWTVRELDFAKDKKKRIVFINIDGSPLTDEFKFDYGRKQQVDGRSSDSLQRLINDIYEWLHLPYTHNQTTTVQSTWPQYNFIRKKYYILIALTIVLSALCGYYYINSQSEIDSEINISHEYVDLALPSGTLWATCNIGAEKPEQFGNYYAWGETEIQSNNSYAWSSYKWCKGSETTLLKYSTDDSFGIIDNLIELDNEDDVAMKTWGTNWRMPTLTHFEELLDSTNTSHEWTEYNGSFGYLFHSKRNGNEIFFPAAGYWSNGTFNGTLYDGYEGDYWSSSLIDVGSSMASSLNMDSTSIGCFTGTFRHCGFSVRAIRR